MAVGNREAKLILSLIDRVSKPANAIVGALGRVNQSTKAMAGMAVAPARAINHMSRSMRHHAVDATVMSAAVSMGLSQAATAVYDYEKAGNRMQAFGLLNEKQRVSLEKEAMRLNKFFPQTNQGILDAAGELFRAGLTYEQALGALEGSLQLSLAGDIDTRAAADIATNIMYAMKMPMETMEQVQQSLQKVNDLLAYGATKSNTDIRLMSDTFRYVAPLAAVAGMEIEQVTALTMDLAKAGIKGAEAGVALRSGLVRMAKPTRPMIAAFNRLGINMQDFVQYKERIEASSITASLLADGYEVDHLSKQIQSILDDKSLAAAPQRMLAHLADLVVSEIGDEAVRDKITDTLQDAIVAGGQKVDLVKLLKVLRDKGATITDISQIFDVRMGSRLAAILYNDLDATTEQVRNEYRGTSSKMAGLMIQGIVGTWLEVTAALENFFVRLSETGVMETVAGGLERFTQGLDNLSSANPRMLELATYGAMALAVLAPLGFAASGAASAIALMANPLALAAGGMIYLASINGDALVSWLKAFGKIFTDNLNPKILDAFGRGVKKVKGWFSDLVNAGSDGEAWGRTAKSWAEASANALNRLYQIGEKFANSRFAKGFQEGFGTAMDNMASAAQKLSNALASINVNIQPFVDFLNTSTGENLGKFLGELSGYGVGLFVAAAGIGLTATAIGALGRALKILSGASAGMAVLSGLAGLFGLGGGGKVPGGKPDGKPRKMPKAAGWFALPALLGAAMYALKDWEGGVWHIDPPKPRKNPLVDYIDEQHRNRRSTSPAKPLPHPGQSRTAADPLLHPGALAHWQRPVSDIDVEEAERKLNTFTSSAGEAGRKAEESLSITARPFIDSSSLDSFLAKIGRAIEGLSRIGGSGVVGSGGAAGAGNSVVGSGRISGARAGGGPVQRGLNYIVGEEGEEVFTPGADGFITPNHALRGGGGGGGNTFYNTFHVHGGNAEEVVRKMIDTMNRQLIRSRQTEIDGRLSYET